LAADVLWAGDDGWFPHVDAAVRALDAARPSARLDDGEGPLGGYYSDDAGTVFEDDGGDY
jgi:hypothetical protein